MCIRSGAWIRLGKLEWREKWPALCDWHCIAATPVTMTGARLHGQRTVTVPLLARCGVNQPLVSADYPLTLIKWSGESTIVPIGKTARSVKFFNSMINSNRENESRTVFFLFFFSFYKRSGIFRIFQVYVDAYEKKTRIEFFSKTLLYNYLNYLQKKISSLILMKFKYISGWRFWTIFLYALFGFNF